MKDKKMPLLQTGAQEDLNEERYSAFLSNLRPFFAQTYAANVARADVDMSVIQHTLAVDFTETPNPTTYSRVGGIIVYSQSSESPL